MGFTTHEKTTTL